MSQVTIITQFSQAGDVTSALRTRGRGYIHAQFRAGSAISNPSVVLSTMSMIIALQTRMLGGDDNMWTDVQTWAVALTEPLAGRDLTYAISEPGIDVRLQVKSFGSGICQARLWEG
jgi:hypothetical protein